MRYRNTKNGVEIKTSCELTGDWERVDAPVSPVEEDTAPVEDTAPEEETAPEPEKPKRSRARG